jgi:hypothetical protein
MGGATGELGAGGGHVSSLLVTSFVGAGVLTVVAGAVGWSEAAGVLPPQATAVATNRHPAAILEIPVHPCDAMALRFFLIDSS